MADIIRFVFNSDFHLRVRLSLGSNTLIGHDMIKAGDDVSVSIGVNLDISTSLIFETGRYRIKPTESNVDGVGFSVPILIGGGGPISICEPILGGFTIGELSIVSADGVVKGLFPTVVLTGGVSAHIFESNLVSNSRGKN